MEAFQTALIWAIFVIAVQPCYDVRGSSFNRPSSENNKVFEIQEKDGDLSLLEIESQGFQPIRIHVHFSLWEHLASHEQNALKRVIYRAVGKVQSIFSVNRLKEPLLLSRKACQGKWSKGVNKGKCGKIQDGYSGEFCMDNFKIPDAHLGKFVVYNSYSEKPVDVYHEDGEGLNNTDFVLYVTSHTTEVCNPRKTSALAYASFCQLGEFNRPIAGQVNFCPRNLKAQKFDEELMYTTSVHEMFHALGFSSKLFDKFVQCENDQCQPWPKEVLSMRDGSMKLATDAVMREMRNHFNCTQESKLGGPLEIVGDKVTSHWDPFLMYTSIMGSREQKPYATLIDRISLAVFEDSGWYKVNYSMADPFSWGKGQGCNYGHKDLCQSQTGFCSENTSGCHHLRLSKARCNVETSNSNCGVLAADQVPCFHPPVNNTALWDEVYVSASRCFMSNVSYVENSLQVATPRCYETKCSEGSFEVKLNGGDWTQCPSGSHIQISPYVGLVECPSYEEICSSIAVRGGQAMGAWWNGRESSTTSTEYSDITPTELFSGQSFLAAKNLGPKASPMVFTGSFDMFVCVYQERSLLCLIRIALHVFIWFVATVYYMTFF